MIYFAIFTLFTVLTGILSVYNGSKKLYNHVITWLFVGMVIAYPFMYIYTLSNPRNIDHDPYLFDEASVVGHYVDYGEAIYYLFEIEGVEGPRFYREDWDENSKDKIKQLQKKGRNIYEPSLSKEKRLHPAIPKMPDKQPDEESKSIQKFEI